MDSVLVVRQHGVSRKMARSTAIRHALTPEARARNEAKRLAGRRIGFLGHALVWAMVGLLLLVTAGFFPALVVALAWGIGLACHGFFAVAAPGLRRRFIEQEVARRVQTSVVDERRALEGRHARSLEELSASVAHEIRNPITAAKSLVQQIREDPSSTDNIDYARIALEELDRVERAVSHLLRYARDEEMRLEELDLAAVVHSALQGLDDRISKSKVRLEQDLDFDATLRGDREKLRRVVMNLVTNALEANEESNAEDPFIRVSSGRNLSGKEIWLRVSDNGPGIEPARLAKVWSPFHTSKANGTGLGLAIVKKLVEAHGGMIAVTSDRSTGTEFVATFPTNSGGVP